VGLLSRADQKTLRETFTAIARPVRLLFFAHELDLGETCLQTRQILAELPPLSDNLKVEEINYVLEPEKAEQYAIERVPAIAVVGQDEAGAERDSHIRFIGTPAGYEFMSLVQAVLLVGGRQSVLTDISRRRIEAVDQPVTMQVFTTPT
jgi:alkyl hydroperoxide reductase subunit AhpF